jgi:hypothetical protein
LARLGSTAEVRLARRDAALVELREIYFPGASPS